MNTAKQDTGSSEWKALLSGKNGIRSMALAGGTALHATNIYLSTTILPSVIKEIGGLAFYAWNTTLFIIASIIGSVFSRKLLAQYGSKLSFRIAFVIFGLGTLICAAAPSMPVMLAGRTIQGLGGGMLFALAYAMVQLIFEQRLWSRAFSLVSGMWGIATLLGPFIGGIFAALHAWRYAFICLIPILLLLLLITERYLPGKQEAGSTASVQISWLKMLLLALSTIAVSVGSLSDQAALNIMGLLVALLLLVVVILLEKRTAIPLLPRSAYSLKKPTGMLYALIALLALYSTVEIFIPYFLQTIQQTNPFKAGFIAAFMAVGWTIGSITFSGVHRRWMKSLLWISACLMIISLLALACLFPQPDAGSGVLFYALCLFIILSGLAIGLVWPHLLTLVLTNADKGEEGLATGAITTVQLVMTSLGAALCGMIANLFGIVNPGGMQGAMNASQWLFGLFILIPVLLILLLLFCFNKSNIR